jgi:RNA polymerase sigma-70 factor (ECF subfamily)
MAEQRFQVETAQTLGPDQLYDQQWALALLGEATARLEREYTVVGKGIDLRELKPYLTEERGHIPYAKIAAALQTTEGAARVAVHRLRKRFRELFREVIAETVSESAEIEEELRYVIAVLGRFAR